MKVAPLVVIKVSVALYFCFSSIIFVRKLARKADAKENKMDHGKKKKKQGRQVISYWGRGNMLICIRKK